MESLVDGSCAPQFAAVRDTFEANFADHGEIGAAVSVVVDGEVVVDLWGGWADEARSRAWAHDTLVDVYSVGKPLVALLLLQLIDAGAVGLDAPVARYWPEFAAGGKGGATVRHALSHQAGVPSIRERLTDDDLWDWGTMTAAVAATEAWWPPGERVSYHTNTFGHLVGGIVERVTGERPGSRFRAHVAAPTGADVWIGLPGRHHHRCADIAWADGVSGVDTSDPFDRLVAIEDPDDRMTFLGYFNPPGYASVGVVNTARWRRAEIPSANTHATARGVAAVYAALLEPGRLLSAEMLTEATRPQSSGFCPTLGEDVTFGLGFKPTTERRPFGPNPRAFGHFGTGGSVGFADPDTGVAMAYAMNRVIPRWQSPCNRGLIGAVFGCL